MRIAIITDQHWGIRGDAQLFLENMLLFYDNVFFPYLEKNAIKQVLILGDTFDRRKYVNIHTLHVFRHKFLNRLRDLDVDVKMIYGNHDIFYRNSNEVNSIDFIAKEYSNVEVVETHKIFDFDGFKLGMISWINSSNLDSSMEFIKTADCDLLCGHFEIKSFEMVKGSFCENGFDKSIFNRFEQVFSGHFHVISTDRRIQYLGNPHQTNWGDHGLKKGFWVFDTATREKEFVENPYNLYEKIPYSDDFDLLKFDYDSYTNKIVRVYVKSFEVTNKKKLDLFIDRLGTKCFSVELQEMTPNADMSDDEVVDLVGSDTSAMIDQYIEQVGHSSSFDKGKLKGYFNEIYHEAQEREVAG